MARRLLFLRQYYTSASVFLLLVFLPMYVRTCRSWLACLVLNVYTFVLPCPSIYMCPPLPSYIHSDPPPHLHVQPLAELFIEDRVRGVWEGQEATITGAAVQGVPGCPFLLSPSYHGFLRKRGLGGRDGCEVKVARCWGRRRRIGRDFKGKGEKRVNSMLCFCTAQQ